MGLESYFGLWAHDPSGDGFCGDGEYPFINREEMEIGDPLLYNIILGFFGETWMYTPVLPSQFNSTFIMKREEDFDYSHRSKYLRNVMLSGSNPSTIIGNDYINHLYGNNGNNNFQGFMGDDTIYGGDGIDRSIYIGDRNDYIVIPPDYTADSSCQIRDIQIDRDGVDDLFDIEEIQFNGVVYQMSELLSTDFISIPKEFALYQPYPNPFNPKTIITFDIPRVQEVLLKVFNVNGGVVRILNNSKLGAGKYRFEWDGRDESGNASTSGVYFIQLCSGPNRNIKKVLLVK